MPAVVSTDVDYSHVTNLEVSVNSFGALQNHGFENLVSISLRLNLQKLLLVLEYLLLLSILLSRDKFRSLELGQLQLLDLFLVLNSQSYGRLLLVIVKLLLLLNQMRLHFRLF